MSKVQISNEDIQKTIMQYVVAKKKDSAILIDGEWGTGKTYFVENILMPKIYKSEMKVVKVSLYGVKKEEDVIKKVYLKIIQDYIPDDVKESFLGKCGEALGKTIQTFLGNSEPSITFANMKMSFLKIDDIVDIANVWTNLEKYVLIFDDFERCEIEPIKILAVINDFIEQKKCKCIIVGNQKEIDRIRIYRNLEMKYQVALNPALKINIGTKYDKKSIDFFAKDKDEEKECKIIEVEELKERVNVLFGEDAEYNVMKEKVIGRTIIYRQELEDVITDIVKESNLANGEKKIILDSKTEIIFILQNYNHYNIRTLKIAIGYFHQIYVVLKKLYDQTDEVNKNAVVEVLKYIILATVKNKTTNKLCDRSTNYENVLLDGVYKSLTAFRFVDKLVSFGFLDRDDIEKTFLQYIEIQRLEAVDTEDPLKVLVYYWEMEDDEIIQYLDKMIDKLKNNNYNIGLYAKIVSLLVKLKCIGFDNDYLVEAVDIMKDNIAKSKNCINEFDHFFGFGLSLDEEEEKKEYDSIIKALKKEINTRVLENKELKINNILECQDGWGEQLGEYYDKNEGEILNAKAFLSHLDIDKLIKLIRTSKVRDISDFRRVVYSVYHYDNIVKYFYIDYENLKLLRGGIDDILNEEKEKMGKTKVLNLQYLMKDLDYVLERLDGNNM